MTKMNADAIALQETNVESFDMIYEKKNYEIYINKANNRCSGQLLILKRTILCANFAILKPGKICAIETIYNGNLLLLINVHLSHTLDDIKTDLTLIERYILDYPSNTRKVILGDFNINYRPGKTEATSKLHAMREFMRKHSLIDVYHLLHPNEYGPTHATLKNNAQVRTRIDYTLCTTNFIGEFEACDVRPYPPSDHDAIVSTLRKAAHEYTNPEFIDRRIFSSHIFHTIFNFEHNLFNSNFSELGDYAKLYSLKTLIRDIAKTCQRYRTPCIPRRRPAITSIYNENGILLHGTQNIMNYVYTFYRNKCMQILSPRTQDFIDFIDRIPTKDVGFDASDENFISREDIVTAIKDIPNGKMAGDDEVPGEFYKKYSNTITESLYKVFTRAQEENALPFYLRQGRMMLLPKIPRPTTIRDWRPITSMNADYKILSKALLNKIKPYASKLIPVEQKHAVPGRSIYDIIPDIEKHIFNANLLDTPLALVALDLEKAFDSVDRHYILAILKRMRLPDVFIRWIQIIFRDNEIRIEINNETSPFLKVSTGVRQGCGLSALLFSIATTALIYDLKESLHPSTTIYAYADDFIFLIKEDRDFTTIRECFARFGSVSRIKVNYGKSTGLWCGSWKGRTDAPSDIKMRNDCINLLGLTLENSRKPFKLQTDELRSNFQQCLSIAKQKILPLPLTSKVRYLNKYFIPKFTYIINSVLPHDLILNELQSEMDDALYLSKTWTNYTINCLPVPNGGLGLLHLPTQRDLFTIKRIQKHVNGYTNENGFLFENKNTTNYQNLFNYDLYHISSPRNKEILQSLKKIAPSFEIDFTKLSRKDFLHLVLLKCRFLQDLRMQNPAVFSVRNLKRYKDLVNDDGSFRPIDCLFSRATRNVIMDFANLTTLYDKLKETKFLTRDNNSCVYLPIVARATKRPFSGVKSAYMRTLITNTYLDANNANTKAERWLLECTPSWHRETNIRDDIAWRLVIRALPYPRRFGKTACPTCHGPPDVEHRYLTCDSIQPILNDAISKCRDIHNDFVFDRGKYIMNREPETVRNILNAAKHDIYKNYLQFDFP
ncbi:hypothetical protein LAZ67_X003377 [Cordylochernes scorpioides]|uniref:Reverse transcriptase domain-containing protein n=1 Tax=Cordylochernes scorpioides TaxID=51811 RepID=A0ABY6LXD3_9ARAC|nr:hypothetical protein LAZ67_X003377 [Cordylochernes scorpioides]